jgi:hypothetical protein
LGGVAIEDRDVWNLIKAMQDAELRYFGTRYSVGQAELKAKKRGRQRAGRILPEPLFVHSDLTTGVRLTELVAYILSWGWRLRSMTGPARPELGKFRSADLPTQA